MSDWLEWKGGTCPVAGGAVVDVTFRNVGEAVKRQRADFWVWYHDGADDDIVAYRVIEARPGPITMDEPAELNGGKLAGDHYYRVAVAEPISPELQPYTAECADIIEALGMTFNEGEAFKALWRLAASRQGRGKPGNLPHYDADKAAHYGARVAACTKRGAR